MIINCRLLLAKNSFMFEQLYRITAAGQVKQISAMTPFESDWTVFNWLYSPSSISEGLDYRPVFPVGFLPFPCVFSQFSGSISTFDLLTFDMPVCSLPTRIMQGHFFELSY